MSFTVFSARGIAHDVETSLSEEAFYFYMHEIIERRLFESYVDDVNGEVKRFTGLVDFMTHKDGLGIKNLVLFERFLDVVASSDLEVSDGAKWLLGQIQAWPSRNN